MTDPFAEFDRVQSETKPLKKTIGGAKFEFPGSCPADIAVDLYSLFLANPKSDKLPIVATKMPRLLGEEVTQRLLEKVDWPSFLALTKGLFVHYGLLSDEEPAPNRKARRASAKGSSKSSARSGATSGASTGSSSRKTSRASVGGSS